MADDELMAGLFRRILDKLAERELDDRLSGTIGLETIRAMLGMLEINGYGACGDQVRIVLCRVIRSASRIVTEWLTAKGMLR